MVTCRMPGVLCSGRVQGDIRASLLDTGLLSIGHAQPAWGGEGHCPQQARLKGLRWGKEAEAPRDRRDPEPALWS